MLAWQVRDVGEPADVLRLDEIPTPSPGPGEVTVRVEAAGLNFADGLLCRGSYQERPPLPFTPGLEMAGTVVDAGPGAPHRRGDRVLGSPTLPHGALAGVAVAAATDVHPLPDDVDAVTAAAMHVTYQTAWCALFRRGALRRGETLVVHAGAGGVGSAAVQLGRHAGATVVAFAGGPEKVARCERLGAHHAFDHRETDVVAAVKDVTGGRGADVVFDPVGGATFEASTRCIAWEGRILVIGAASGTYAAARTNHVMVKNYAVVGVHWGGYRTRAPQVVRDAHDALCDLLRTGAIVPEIGETVDLDGVPDALGRLLAGATAGKVVVVT